MSETEVRTDPLQPALRGRAAASAGKPSQDRGAQAPAVLAFLNLTLDPTARVASGPGGVLELDAAASVLLERLLQTPGTMVARTDLLELLYTTCPAAPPKRLLKKRAKQVRAVLGVLTGGAVRLQMRGSDLFAVTRNQWVQGVVQ